MASIPRWVIGSGAVLGVGVGQDKAAFGGGLVLKGQVELSVVSLALLV
jgi:hypothetical protein